MSEDSRCVIIHDKFKKVKLLCWVAPRVDGPDMSCSTRRSTYSQHITCSSFPSQASWTSALSLNCERCTWQRCVAVAVAVAVTVVLWALLFISSVTAHAAQGASRDSRPHGGHHREKVGVSVHCLLPLHPLNSVCFCSAQAHGRGPRWQTASSAVWVGFAAFVPLVFFVLPWRHPSRSAQVMLLHTTPSPGITPSRPCDRCTSTSYLKTLKPLR